MPQIIVAPDGAEIEFPDDMADDAIAAVMQKEYAAPLPEPEQGNDILQRIPADIARSSMNTLAGGVRALGLASQGLGRTFGVEMDAPYQGTADALAEKGQELFSYYDTDPNQDQKFRSKLSQGASSIVTALGTGPLAPITGGLQAGEAGYQDAINYNGTPEDAALSFAGNAAVTGVTEKLLGIVPNLPKLIRGIPAKSFAEGALRTAQGILKGSAMEASQEALQQVASNLIAQETYHPERDTMEGVGEAALLGGVLGGGMGGLVRGGTTEIDRGTTPATEATPEITPTSEVLSQIVDPEPVEDLGQPDLTGLGSAAMPAAPVVTPEQQASATILNQDPTELRQQEAIVTGNPAAVIEEAPVEEEVLTTPEETPTEQAIPETPAAVEAPLAAEEGIDATQAPEGLTALDPDAYETLADEPLREGWVGLQDPETLQVFQVPEGSTPEVIQQRLQEVRSEESEAFRAEREAALERELTQQRFDENVQRMAEIEEAFLKERGPILKKDLTANTPVEELWSEVDQLPFIIERQKGRLAEAKKKLVRAQSSGDPQVRKQAREEVDAFQKGVDAMTERLTELKAKVVDAQKAFKGMKKGGKESGATAIPQVVFELGQTLYRKGMDFATWSKAMVKALGAQIKPMLADIWSAVVSGVDSLSPAGRRFKRAGAVGRQAPQEVYDVVAEDVRISKTDTQPNEDFGEAEKQAIRDAYIDITSRTGFGSASIADVMEAAEFKLGRQAKGFLMQMYRDGEITSLNQGDWSLADNRKRAWGVRNNGDIFLTISMPAGMQRSAPTPEGGSLGSQGGRRGTPPPATPTAATEEAPQATPVGVMNANVDAARVKMGLPLAMAPAKITLGGLWEEAMALIAADPNLGTDLVTQLSVAPREITPVETAILVHERVMRDTAYTRALELVNNSQNEGELMGNQEVLRRASDANQALFDVTKKVGTLAGQALAARKLLVNDDFSLTRMLAENRAAQGGKELSAKQVEEITKLQAELQKAKDDLEALQEKQSKQDAMSVFKSMMKDLNSERREAIQTGKSVTEFLNEQADKARARLKGKMAKLNNFIPDPTILVDLAIIGSSHIANGINSLADFTARMVGEFGPEVEPFVPDIYEQSQKLHESNKAAFTGAPASTAAPTPAAPQTPADILKDAKPELNARIVFELARAYVRQGVTGMENVIGAVHADLAKIIPGLTLRDVRDAFSGYGKTTYPSKQEDLVKLRDYKALARLTSQLEDVMRRQAPLRTGPQRDKLSAEARILQKQINDLMKKYDIRTTSPEQQLKTAADAVKTRLRNQIEELEKSIQENQALPSNRRTLQYDAEAKALAARRDALKARYNELFKPPGQTPEEKIQGILKNLDKAIAMESQMLREGVLKRPPGAPRPTNQQIEDKQMELDAMRQLRRELYAETQPKKSAEDVALEQAIKAAEASIKRMDEMFKSGNLTPAQRAQRFNATPELEALWSERDAMRDALAELRRAQKPRTDPEETRRKQAIKALTKSIAEYDRRLRQGDFSDTPRPTRNVPNDVQAMRAERDAMRKLFQDLKKAQTPPKDPVEVRLARDKKVIQSRIRKLQEKIATGDYSTAVKPEPPMDAEKRQLQFDYQKLRETYLKGLFELQLKQRGPARKVLGTIEETLNLSRAILTSADFSGVLRQGGFVAFGNPVRAAKSFPAMFKAFGSQAGQFAVEQEIKDRPNYALYNRAGLYLAEDAPASLSKMEEAYMSRWIEKVPGPIGGLLRGSQRAYTTFLNKLRADTFDAMVAGLALNGAPTLDEAKAIANFVNVATGRGELGKLAPAGVALNTIFFAPRYVASRFQLLAGQPFYGGNARTRKLIAKEYAKYLMGIGSVMALLAAAGDDEERGKIAGFSVPIELDPRSSDFLKLRFGNTRLDPFSGLLQVTTLISRVASGETKSGKDKIVPIRGDKVPFGSPSTADVIGRFLRTKLSPALGSGIDLVTGKNVVGEAVGPKEAAFRMMVPISFGEILETIKEQGVPKGPALSLLSLFGVGLQTYPPKEPSKKKGAKDPYKSAPLGK